MKQFLAVEKLTGEDGAVDWFRLVFSAHDWDSAENWAETYRFAFGTELELCGELTD